MLSMLELCQQMVRLVISIIIFSFCSYTIPPTGFPGIGIVTWMDQPVECNGCYMSKEVLGDMLGADWESGVGYTHPLLLWVIHRDVQGLWKGTDSAEPFSELCHVKQT